VYVGGGQGRTPMVAKLVRDFLPEEDLLAYCTAILRVYNLEGRRDNKYKARIKILVHEIGAEAFSRKVEAEFEALRREGALALPADDVARIERYFALPDMAEKPDHSDAFDAARASDKGFAAFVGRNVEAHKVPGYASVTISLKPIGGIPGDASAEEMESVADLAERHGHDEIRVSHEQNLILPHVALDDVPAVYQALVEAGLETPNAGLITDIIACPGLDYCALANARSIPVAQDIAARFSDQARQEEIGDLKLKISGCINACGHHHVGHIGILGVEKKGEELYQLTLGGSADEDTAIGQITGRGFSADEIGGAVETVVNQYLELRTSPDEAFIETYRRLGAQPFKEALYG
ncbi:MAG: nitrite/sulfite reductase, partial [Pseudomonadota bacterium]